MSYSVDFIPEYETGKFSLVEKTRYILSQVMRNKILILENALSPEEELYLIEKTMNKIDYRNFVGIKLFSFDSGEDNRFSKICGKSSKKRSTYTIVAPNDAVSVVKDERGILSIRINV